MKKISFLFLFIFVASLVLYFLPELSKAAQVQENNYKPGEILIKFKTDKVGIAANQKNFTGEVSSLNNLNNKFKIEKIESAIKNLNKSKDKVGLNKIYKIEFNQNEDVKKVVDEYQKNPDIEWAEPNYQMKIALTPNDSYYSSQWALSKISASQAWDIGTGSTGVIIAIIDTGVDYDHPDLATNMWANAQGYHGYDFVNNDNDPMDDNGHGTHCAGIASAVTNNGRGVAGVSWSSKIMAVKTFNSSGSGDTDICANGITYAVSNGAQIISMSWGNNGGSSFLADTINNAYSLGCILVGAAGNDNSESEFYPAAYNNVLAVAATDSSDHKASFSNYGDWVDVSAPGVNIRSTYWDNTYQYLLGTSMACPHVAGLAALIKAKYPTLSQNQISSKIISSTDNIDGLNPGYTGKLGSGRINAYRAMMPLTHPSGTLIQVKSPYSPFDPGVYRLEGGNKRLIPDPYVFNSQFSWNKIIAVSTTERDNYPTGTILPFRDGELVKEKSDPRVYVFENGQKRWITALEIFKAYKYSWNNVIMVPNGQLSQFTTAESNLSSYAANSYPGGSLLKASNDVKVYRIENGQKRHVPDIYVFNSQFSWNKVITVAPSVLSDANYPLGNPFPFRDGELVKEQGNPKVYVFENGKKRWITSLETFNAYRYSWSNVINVPSGALSAFDEGEEPLSI